MAQTEPNDSELLRRYEQEASEPAFAELVRRHLPLVYHAALRQVEGDPHTAQDVAQSVFIELARKARRLRTHPALVGWLYTTTRQIASHIRRSHQRRDRREMEAIAMHDPAPDTTEEWRQLRPVLDDAMHELPETDRLALLFRYFEGRDLREVGQALGVTDNAARMRVERALESLRSILVRRGITTTVASLAALLGAQTTSALPLALTTSITAASITAAVSSGGLNVITTAFSAMKPTITNGLLTMLVATPLVLQELQIRRAHSELAQWQVRLTEAETVQSARQAEQARSAVLADELTRLRADEAEHKRLKAEAQQLQGALTGPDGGRLASATAALRDARSALDAAMAEAEAKAVNVKTINAMKHLGLAARIFANDHQDRFPTTFDDMKQILEGQLPEDMSLDRFEFYPQPRPVSENEPQLFLFREKNPRRQTDGRWLRTYTLADGSVQSATSTTPDFTEWEKAHHGIASPEPPAPFQVPQGAGGQ